MEPYPSIFKDLMYPSALWAGVQDYSRNSSGSSSEPRLSRLLMTATEKLRLAPGNLWRIDGCEIDATRYFAVPAFAIGKPPLRIDVYVPDPSDQSLEVRRALQPETAIMASNDELRRLPFSIHLIESLNNWTGTHEWVQSEYMSMPFGSRIVIEIICNDVNESIIHLMPEYETELQWLSLAKLKEMWQLPEDVWPEVLALERLQLQSQPHEAISLVTIDSDHKTRNETFVFKSLIHDTKYFYHELKMYLTMAPHINIMSRPLYLITKQCRFGGKVGVCGFILKYLPGGTLRDVIYEKSRNKALSRREQYRWAHETVSAFIHINKSRLAFYSDLKLNNILMAGSGEHQSPVLVDFEQRGGWYCWSPPEVYYVEYLEYIATHSPDVSARDTWTQFLRNHVPGWRTRSRAEAYQDCEHGHNNAWLSLTTQAREAAQVFMLGKLLWCIFEGQSSLNNAMSYEIFREQPSDQEFPTFNHTSIAMRDCIKRCTSGAPEWEGRLPPLIRRGNKLYPRARAGEDGEQTGTMEETQKAAKCWWEREVHDAEAFLRARKSGNLGDQRLAGLIAERPTLEEVLAIIQDDKHRTTQ